MELVLASETADLEALEAEQLETGPAAVELLDELPTGEDLFASAPDDVLRQLFQTFRLEVRFDKPSHRANCRVTIDENSVAALGSDSGNTPFHLDGAQM